MRKKKRLNCNSTVPRIGLEAEHESVSETVRLMTWYSISLLERGVQLTTYLEQLMPLWVLKTLI